MATALVYNGYANDFKIVNSFKYNNNVEVVVAVIVLETKI